VTMSRRALAVRIAASGGERWLELTNPEKKPEDQLYIQPRDENDSNGNAEDTAPNAAQLPSPIKLIFSAR